MMPVGFWMKIGLYNREVVLSVVRGADRSIWIHGVGFGNG